MMCVNNQPIKIDLKYKAILTVVSDRDNGKMCYNEQMKETIIKNIDNVDICFEITFPEHIRLVSGSYLLGMFEEINSFIGIRGINERFSFSGEKGEAIKKKLINELIRSGC